MFFVNKSGLQLLKWKQCLYNCFSVCFQCHQDWYRRGLVNFAFHNLNHIFFYSRPISLFFGSLILEAREKMSLKVGLFQLVMLVLCMLSLGLP